LVSKLDRVSKIATISCGIDLLRAKIDLSVNTSLKPPPIPELYERNSDFWAAARTQIPFFEKKYLDRILCDRPKGSPILDVGCGSGQPIAEYLVAQGAPVTGCDISPSMIQKSRARIPAQDWVVADMRTLDLRRRFGALVAWDSFFHLTQAEQRQTLLRFREHLLPGGILLFTSGPARGEQIGALNGELLYHASLAPEEYRNILRGLAFSKIEFCAKDEECGNHSVWIAWLDR
jgi:SAM-dependent methyltransferase